MRLPNAAFASVAEEKFTKYLLNLAHPEGGSKAKFFMGYGFTLQSWHLLKDAVWVHAQQYDVVSTEIQPFGTNYALDGLIDAPNGAKPNVRTIWCISTGASTPHFVSAYPAP